MSCSTTRTVTSPPRILRISATSRSFSAPVIPAAGSSSNNRRGRAASATASSTSRCSPYGSAPARSRRAGQHGPEAGGATQMQPRAHIVEHAERGEHARALERADDTATGDVAGPPSVERLALPRDASAARSQIAGDGVERGGLARAVRTDEAGDRAGLHAKRDSGEREHAAERDPEIF